MMSTLRTILERASRGRTFIRHLPESFGNLPLVVSPDAQLKYLRPGAVGFDASLLSAVQMLVRPGDNVWDVGANVGVFSVAAAALSRTGQIVAIEADIWLAALLRRTSRLNAGAGLNLQVLPSAAYASAGIAELVISKRGRASNHLSVVNGSSQTGGTRETVLVPTLPLDALLDHFSAPDVVKIDVEGAELGVLQGMKRVLGEKRPLVYCEVSSRTCQEVLALMREHDYEPRNLQTGAVENSVTANMLFVCRERGGLSPARPQSI